MTIKDTTTLITLLAGVAVNLVSQESFAAGKDGDWSLQQLHEPSPSLRRMEDAGHITIYDGLAVSEVDAAMDRQFDRIGSMMFVRTRHPVAEGGFETDSDCD